MWMPNIIPLISSTVRGYLFILFTWLPERMQDWFPQEWKQSLSPVKTSVPDISDGITLFDEPGSIDSRKVRAALFEKNIQWNPMSVDRMMGESRKGNFVNMSPHGKLAIRFKNVDGVQDGTLFDANVICEYIDTVFPTLHCLWPSDRDEKMQVYKWMDWENMLIEDLFPFIQNNLTPFLIRLQHWSREDFMKSLPNNCPWQVRHAYVRLYDGDRLKSEDELKLHALACYQLLIQLETELQGKTYLVGEKLSMADLCVFPRISMFCWVGLPIPAKDFPNVTAYLTHMGGLPCIRNSESWQEWQYRMLFTHMQWLAISIGNWRSEHNYLPFDGSQVINRAFGEVDDVRNLSEPLPWIPDDQFVVFSYDGVVEPWQIKLLLKVKGVSYREEECNFLEVIGRPQGSDGIFRVQHGTTVVNGMNSCLAYLDMVTPGKAMVPVDAWMRAQCHWWLSWESIMYSQHIYPLLHVTLFADMLIQKFPEEEYDELLRLKSHPFLKKRFPEMLCIYLNKVTLGTEAFFRLQWAVKSLNLSSNTHAIDEEEHLTQLHFRLQYIDCSLKGRSYLLGEEMSLADLCVFCRLCLMPVVGMKISDRKYPDLCSWITRLREDEYCQQIEKDFSRTIEKYTNRDT